MEDEIQVGFVKFEERKMRENSVVKLLCSYNGEIKRRLYEYQLSYVGGETKFIKFHRTSDYGTIYRKATEISGLQNVSIKYKLFDQDLDVLISVSNNDDVRNMLDEYDMHPDGQRFRMFLFPNCLAPVPGWQSNRQGILGEEVFASKLTLFDMTKQTCNAIQAGAEEDKNHGVILFPEGLIESIPEIRALMQEIHSLQRQGVSVDNISSQLSPRLSALFEFLPIFIKKQLLLHPESDDSAQLSQIETEKLLAHLVETEMNKRSGILGEEVFASKLTLFDMNHGVILLPEGLIESIPEIPALLQEIQNLQRQGVSVDNISSQLSPRASTLFEFLLIFIKKQLLLHPESDDSSQLSQIETEKLLAHLVETEMNKRMKEGTYTGKKFNAQGPFGSYFLAHATPFVRKEETRESDELTRLLDQMSQMQAQIPNRTRPSFGMQSRIPKPWSLFQKYTDLFPGIDLAQKGESSLQIPKEEILKNEEIIKNSDLEVIRLLGKGDHGAIYHGKWKGADVCIKRVNITAIQDAEFRQEVEKLSKLSHPNVVAFYGEVPDNPGTIMTEFMVNYSLRNEESRKILRNRSDGELKKLIIAFCAASAMEYLHSKDVIHKDLKTNNLLLNLKDHGRPICKVGDFEFFNFKIKTRTEEEEMDSSIPWLAPEVLDGSSYEDPKKVDVFAFGVVLWEIFTLEEPYKNMNYHDVKVGVRNKSLRPPVSNKWNFELQNLMQECWAHDPSARPSFEEISRRLLLIKAEVEKMIKKKKM